MHQCMFRRHKNGDFDLKTESRIYRNVTTHGGAVRGRGSRTFMNQHVGQVALGGVGIFFFCRKREGGAKGEMISRYLCTPL